MLQLALNEEQQMIQRVAREYLKESSPTLNLRPVELSDTGYDEGVWRGIQEMGWVGLPFQPEVGGEGSPLTTAAVICEEMGKVCVPSPLQSVWNYGLLLEALGDTDNLKALISGDAVGVAALWEADAPYEADSTQAELSDGGILNGVKLLVAYANAASKVLVLARNSAGKLQFALANIGDLSVERTPSSGGDRLFAIGLNGAQAVKVYDADAEAVLKSVLPKMVALDAAWMVGLAGKAFELAVEYTKTRVQFGRPIGSFQAVQHKIADAGVAVEGGRFLAYKAAWSADRTVEEATLASHYAKAWLNYISESVIKEMHQVHGAMGMTWEYDLHLATRRLKAASLSYGDYHQHREAVLASYEARLA